MTNFQEPILPPVCEADNDPKNIKLYVDKLRSQIERIERLEEEKQGFSQILRIFLPRLNLVDLILK